MVLDGSAVPGAVVPGIEQASNAVALVGSQLEDIDSGDWDQTLAMFEDSVERLVEPIALALIARIASQDFPGPDRRLADHEQRAELVRRLNALLKQLGIVGISPFGNTQDSGAESTARFMVHGKRNAFGVSVYDSQNKKSLSRAAPSQTKSDQLPSFELRLLRDRTMGRSRG